MEKKHVKDIRHRNPTNRFTMTEPKYIKQPKTRPDGSPNPDFYEEMLETVTEILGAGKKPSNEKCVECNEIGHTMYNYKTRKWYIECACEEPIEIIRETKIKAISAWNVQQIIKNMEKLDEL